MEIGHLYKVNRSNQTETAGLLIKGTAVNLLGSTSKPSQASDMVSLLDDGEVLTEGAWPIILLPEYIMVTGTADSVDITGISIKDLGEL